MRGDELDVAVKGRIDAIERRVRELMGIGTAHDHGASLYSPPLSGHQIATGVLTDYHRYAGEGEASMANLSGSLSLYEVIIVDSREADDDAAVCRYYVRATNAGDARIRAILRAEYKESDIEYLDFDIRTFMTAKPVVDADDDE